MESRFAVCYRACEDFSLEDAVDLSLVSFDVYHVICRELAPRFFALEYLTYRKSLGFSFHAGLESMLESGMLFEAVLSRRLKQTTLDWAFMDLIDDQLRLLGQFASCLFQYRLSNWVVENFLFQLSNKASCSVTDMLCRSLSW